MAARGDMNQFYAPKPTVPATHLYPPLGRHDNASSDEFTLNDTSSDSESSHGYKKEGGDIGIRYTREVSRTPSPTPSEAEALTIKTGTVNLKKYLDPTYFKNPKNLMTFVITLVIIGALIAFAVEQDNIIKALKPFSDWMRRTPGAWLIPIAIMIVLSFPPLFGHELVAALVGDVWGLGIGFGIVAAGTIFGELATFYTFRYCCGARGKKAEAKNLQYALLSEVIREGGFKMALIIRYSAIPGHLSTAIFSTCGMSVYTFLLAAFLALPKQLAAVYLGIDNNSSDDATNKKNKIVKIIVIGITVVMTMIAMRYVNAQIDAIKHRVIYARRKARQGQLGDVAATHSADTDLEDAPLVPRPAAGTFDSSAPLPPRAQPRQHTQYHGYAPPSHPPPTTSSTTAGYDPQARYDDPYAGRDAFGVGALRPLRQPEGGHP